MKRKSKMLWKEKVRWMRCFEERKWRPSLESLLTTLYSAQPGLKKRMFRWTISSITKKLSKIHNNNSQRDHWGFNNYRYFLAWHPARTRFGPAGGNRASKSSSASQILVDRESIHYDTQICLLEAFDYILIQFPSMLRFFNSWHRPCNS